VSVHEQFIWPHDYEGYEPDSPKSPGYYDRITNRADDDRKNAREAGVPNPLIEDWKREQEALAEAVGRCEHGDVCRCIRPVGHEGGHFSVWDGRP
jgi:hypothetical protein